MDSTISRRVFYSALTALLGLLFLPLVWSAKQLYFECVNAIDFSIYQQGIWDISAFLSWNPYLPLHDVNFFNDHFTPGLLGAIPFIWASGFSPYSLLFVEWGQYLAGLALTLYLLRPGHTEILWVTALYVLTKGFLAGLAVPIHPDTWSIPLWLGLVWGLKEKNLKAILLFAIGASLFKEYFSFGVVGLSLYYLALRDWKFFWPVFAWGVGYSLFCFVLRPLIIGEVFAYSAQATRGLGTGPLEFFVKRARDFDYAVAFKLYYPFILPLAWIARYQVKNARHLLFPALATLLPLLGLHFLTNRIYDQYAPALTAIPLGVVFFSGFVRENAHNYKLMFACTALFLVSSASVHTKFLSFLFTGQAKKCNTDTAKVEKRRQALATLSTIRKEHKIYASGGIIPHLYRPGMQLFQIGGFNEMAFDASTIVKDHVYDYVLIEKKGHGDVFPIPLETLPNLVDSCRGMAEEVLQDDDYFLLARGRFRRRCGLDWSDGP